MSKVVFNEHYGYIIDPSKTKPVNEVELNKFKIEVEKELDPYIDKINACGGIVDITINQDGNKFEYRLLEMKDHKLFAQIMDELHSK